MRKMFVDRLPSIKVSDRILFDTHSNLGVREDVVRGKFAAETLLEPYARNTKAAALTLTHHSWTFESNVIAIIR